MAKNKYIKTIRAGNMVWQVCYVKNLASDTKKERAAKTLHSSEARKRLNFRTAWQKLQLILLENFVKGDLWITLTYDDEHLPENRKAAKKAMQGFIDKMRAARRSSADEFRYVYVTQELLEDGGKRLHHHLVLNTANDKKDFELIKSLWAGGANVEICFLGENKLYGDDLIEIAQYMCHERDPDASVHNVGDKCWCGSRNLRKPQITCELVDEAVTICAPPGAVIIDQDHKRNEYGVFDYLQYRMPEQPPKRPPKSKEGLSSF